MNLITNRQVITENTSNCCGMSNFDSYSNANSDMAKKKRSGKFGEKIKGGYQKVKEAGGLSFLENIFGLNQNTNQNTYDPNANVNFNQPTKQPMSTTTKILIGLAVAGVVGFGVYYFGFRKKSGK